MRERVAGESEKNRGHSRNDACAPLENLIYLMSQAARAHQCALIIIIMASPGQSLTTTSTTAAL